MSNYYRKCHLCGGEIQEKKGSKRFVKASNPSKILYGHKEEVRRKIDESEEIEEV